MATRHQGQIHKWQENEDIRFVEKTEWSSDSHDSVLYIARQDAS